MVVLSSIAHQSHAYARERLKEIKNQLAEVRAQYGASSKQYKEAAKSATAVSATG